MFGGSAAAHYATSIVDLKMPEKEAIVDVFVKNWDVLSFSDKVVVDADMYAISKVCSYFRLYK